MLLLTRVGCRRVREVFVEPLIRFLLEGYVDYWELLVEALVSKVLESFEGWVRMVFLVRLAEVSWADSRVRGRVVDEIVEGCEMASESLMCRTHPWPWEQEQERQVFCRGW